MGSLESWQRAEASLVEVCEGLGLAAEPELGEAAFYGPKADFVVTDCIGREWQLGTVQLDYNLPSPERFDLEYIGADNHAHRPVMIHRAPLGSMERFIGILTEHYKGHFPFWLAPIQARILTITDSQKEYATKVLEKLSAAGIRVELDETGGQISAQIRKAQMDKIPWMLVIGKKEEEKGTVTLRHTDGKQEFGLTIEALLEKTR